MSWWGTNERRVLEDCDDGDTLMHVREPTLLASDGYVLYIHSVRLCAVPGRRGFGLSILVGRLS